MSYVHIESTALRPDDACMQRTFLEVGRGAYQQRAYVARCLRQLLVQISIKASESAFFPKYSTLLGTERADVSFAGSSSDGV
jgi:hypothetical protein